MVILLMMIVGSCAPQWFCNASSNKCECSKTQCSSIIPCCSESTCVNGICKLSGGGPCSGLLGDKCDSGCCAQGACMYKGKWKSFYERVVWAKFGVGSQGYVCSF